MGTLNLGTGAQFIGGANGLSDAPTGTIIQTSVVGTTGRVTVNTDGSYTDIICDSCSDITRLEDKYDKIICIAILEHVYDPFKAVSNLQRMLKKNGKIYGMVPYLYHYHAPKDLKFQDYFRFSKDALAYLFRDFKNVELYPIRGRVSSSLHLMFAGRWKKYMEKTNINAFLDKFSSSEKNSKQCSGFNFILEK